MIKIVTLLLTINFLFAGNTELTKKEMNFITEYSNLKWSKIELTENEKKWINEKHKVKILIGDWAPYLYFENNIPKGIAVDYINLISKKNNFQVEFESKYTFSQGLQLLKNQKEIDLITILTNTKERSKDIIFTKNYLMDSWVIITKTNEKYIGGLSDLYGKVIATTKGYVYNNIIKKQFPQIKIKSYDKDENAILAVSTGQANAYIGIVAVSTYIIQKYNISNLKIAAPAGLEPNINAMGIRKDWPELASIINKSLEAMPAEMHNLIHHHSLSVNYNHGIPKEKIWMWGFIIFGIVLSVILVLQNNNRKLKQLINSTIEAVIIFKDGKLIQANDRLLKLYGCDSIKEIKGKDIYNFVDKKQHFLLKRNLHISKGPYELNLINKKGELSPALVKGTYIGDGKIISTIIDLTELKKAQNKLKILNENLEKEVSKQVEENRIKDKMLFHQAKLASMGEMINNIAHQWRQPLSSINSIVVVMDSILKKDNIKNKKLEKNFCDIELQTKYMSDTIENFRNFFQPNKQKEDFLLSHAVTQTLKIIETNFQRNQIELNLEIKLDKNIKGYSGELTQVLITILNNSKDALKNSNIENPKILIKIENNITIEDNAGGIKIDALEKIFEPYFTTKHPSEGIGIGLYMAKMIVENSFYGMLKVENTKNGAKFTIDI
ncbi:MAG: hypothetical protein C0625_13040 [Arcobacter sp.]|nr:MAG: hypothetical protein C0625_13040 [Arcobacter sp.]